MINTYAPKFTYVIPFRFRQDRIIPLRRLVDWLSGFQNCEILIVEQDTHSKIEHLNIRANHFFIKSDLPFNKSWAYNVALKRSISPVLIFGDADVIMDPLSLIEALKQLETYDCVAPLKEIINLSPQESLIDSQSILKIDRQGDVASIGDGILLFNKQALFSIGGWNEDIIGLGNYDNKFIDLKISKLLNFKKMDYKGYHFSHQVERIDFNLMQRNQQIIDQFKNDDSNNTMLKQHTNITIPKIGMSNKYI